MVRNLRQLRVVVFVEDMAMNKRNAESVSPLVPPLKEPRILKIESPRVDRRQIPTTIVLTKRFCSESNLGLDVNSPQPPIKRYYWIPAGRNIIWNDLDLTSKQNFLIESSKFDTRAKHDETTSEKDPINRVVMLKTNERKHDDLRIMSRQQTLHPIRRQSSQRYNCHSIALTQCWGSPITHNESFNARTLALFSVIANFGPNAFPTSLIRRRTLPTHLWKPWPRRLWPRTTRSWPRWPSR